MQHLTAVLRLLRRWLSVGLVVVLLTFFLLFSGSRDVANQILTSDLSLAGGLDVQLLERERQKIRKLHGLDLPLFYVRITSAIIPRYWDRNQIPEERGHIEKWANQCGNYQYASKLFKGLGVLQNGYLLKQQDRIDAVIKKLEKQTLPEKLKSIVGNYDLVEKPFIANLPRIQFYTQNQFGRWLFGDCKRRQGAIRGDFGISYIKGIKVWEIIRSKIGWSFYYGLMATFLAFAIGIPLGTWMAFKSGKKIEQAISNLAYLIYAIPSFWMATLLLMTFANPSVIQLFPSSGVEPMIGIPSNIGFFERLAIVIPYTILPTICFAYGSVIYLSRMVKQSTLQILQSQFVRAAELRQLPRKDIIKSYVIKNSLLPTITVFGAVFPALIGGSVILETIFTIPGLGRQVYYSALAADAPVLMCLVLLTAFLSILGYYLSDRLYSYFDPRIKLAV